MNTSDHHSKLHLCQWFYEFVSAAIMTDCANREKRVFHCKIHDGPVTNNHICTINALFPV